MEEISEEGKKALWERERSQPCSWKLGMEKHIQQKKMSELALKGKKRDILFHPPHFGIEKKINQFGGNPIVSLL